MAPTVVQKKQPVSINTANESGKMGINGRPSYHEGTDTRCDGPYRMIAAKVVGNNTGRKGKEASAPTQAYAKRQLRPLSVYLLASFPLAPLCLFSHASDQVIQLNKCE